jgi:hypothetical protein
MYVEERVWTAVRYYPDRCAKYLGKTMTDKGYSVADRQTHYRCVVAPGHCFRIAWVENRMNEGSM